MALKILLTLYPNRYRIRTQEMTSRSRAEEVYYGAKEHCGRTASL